MERFLADRMFLHEPDKGGGNGSTGGKWIDGIWYSDRQLGILSGAVTNLTKEEIRWFDENDCVVIPGDTGLKRPPVLPPPEPADPPFLQIATGVTPPKPEKPPVSKEGFHITGEKLRISKDNRHIAGIDD